MNDIDVFEADLDGQDLRIAIVQARFNEEHCQALSESCINELLALGVSHADIQLVTVPGALEILTAPYCSICEGDTPILSVLAALL